ncbi:ATP-binding protein [Oscillatoriales cyanobacterium USR001]|nr:ATP-binding protein [Oscillatoriales cyanobacterium USR001]
MIIHIVGIGLDGAAGLTKSLQQIVDKATLLVGSDRHLSYFPKYRGERLLLGDLMGAIAEIRQRLSNKSSGTIAILVSGDPLFFGWGRLFVAELPPDKLVFHPHLSSVQLAFNRLKITWQDAYFISAHSRCFEELTGKLQQGINKIAVLTDETHSPGAIANLIKALDLPIHYEFWVCENLGSPDEKVEKWELDNLQNDTFSPLNIVVLLRQSKIATEPLDLANLPMLGIPDSNFLSFSDRPNLITKKEVRVLVLGELSLQPGQVIWDVGAGTGTVSIEIARLFPDSQVYAIENTPTGTSLIEQNCRRFQLQNVISIHGNAPEILHRLRQPNRIFISDSSGEISKILGVCALRILPGGVIVLAIATLENLAAVLSWKEERIRREPNWNCRIMQVQLSRSIPEGNLTRFDSLNPITIVTMKR